MISVPGCLLILSLCRSFALEAGELSIVILSQGTHYHSRHAHSLREAILSSPAAQDGPIVRLVPEDFPHPGAWTVIPTFPRLYNLDNGRSRWIFFCEERTVVDLELLLKGLAEFDHTKEEWVGYGLVDTEPSIIHHFALPETRFSYPLFPAGFAISAPLLLRLAKQAIELKPDPSDFSIDASHELALFVNITLNRASNLFCLKPAQGCASYPGTLQPCGDSLRSDQIFFAVKTCHKFHENRVPIVQSTWGKKAKYIEFFSDKQNESIPTTGVGIKNTERGHCKKSIKILEMMIKKIDRLKDIEWIILADDDTIISVPRLQSVLKCFKRDSVVGERYGYNVKHPNGYNYITGGGGIAFGVDTLEVIVSRCHCPAADAPDDMFLGLCLSRLGVPLVHSPLFHQARPMDYPEGYLETQVPVSFHKHWMLDPISVYNQWFSKVDHEISHTEL